MTSKLESGLQIGIVAARSGLTIDTIRFYEKQGLVAKPHRSAGGFRLYGGSDLERLTFVSRAQALGFSLLEIRDLLLFHDEGREACPHVRDLLNHKLANVRQKIADLRKLETELEGAREQCDLATTKLCNDTCPLIEEFADHNRGPR